jgi:hypothetical protein
MKIEIPFPNGPINGRYSCNLNVVANRKKLGAPPKKLSKRTRMSGSLIDLATQLQTNFAAGQVKKRCKMLSSSSQNWHFVLPL